THGYLMYGFPGETALDAINGLEVLRQLLRAGLLQSGFYHQLSVTAHAPLGKKPELFNIRLKPYPHRGFARNQVPFEYLDNTYRSERFFDRLVEAMEWYQRGRALDAPVHELFKGIPAPPPT